MEKTLKIFSKTSSMSPTHFGTTVLPTKQEVLELHHEESERNTVARQMVDPEAILELAVKLVKEAKNEILIMFSTANAFHRQERSGGYNLLKSAEGK